MDYPDSMETNPPPESNTPIPPQPGPYIPPEPGYQERDPRQSTISDPPAPETVPEAQSSK